MRTRTLLLPTLLFALPIPAGATMDYATRLDANRLSFPVSNFGSFGYAVPPGVAGFEYPRGSGATCLFAGGLWIGAKVDGGLRLALAEYSMDFGPGPMVDHSWLPDAPEFRVFEVRYGDTTGTAAWMSEAVPQGAPIDQGAPLVLGSRTLWTIYNDANPGRHTSRAGRTAPLGVEVDQLAWSYEELSARREAAFLSYRVHNASPSAWDSVFVALWADIDLGGASDDRMGSDSSRSLVYAYNGDDDDAVYGASPPAIGIRMLEGPPVHATNTYIGGDDPDTSVATWGLLLGLRRNGTPWIDPTRAQPTRFPYPGDPVTNAGWIQPLDSETRMMLVSGPIALQPNESRFLLYAVVVGRGPDRLASITRMRAIADSMDLRYAYAPLVPIPPPPAPSTVLAFAPPPSPHQGALTFSATAPVGEAWRMDAYDVRGRRVARIGSGVGTGFAQQVPWSASGLGSGVYFVSLTTDADRITHRLVVLAP